MKKVLKVILAILCLVLGLIFLVIGGLNVFKFIIYSEYYGVEETVCRNPGLGDGFVCQGICVSEDKGVILVSGYMADGTNSRIYVTDFESESYYVSLTVEGEKYKGHAGGIALSGDRVYVASSSKLFTTSLDEILACKSGEVLDMSIGAEVAVAASFVFADEEYVYVGEYNDPNGKQKNHIYTAGDITNHAIIEKYSHDDLETPVKIYSIGDYVQGACFTPDGEIVLSTSYGLTSSVYYVFDESETYDSGEVLDGVPVYHLGECHRELRGPAMGEDLDWYDGRVITLTESASNKYIFGKFFFAFDIVVLDFSQ